MSAPSTLPQPTAAAAFPGERPVTPGTELELAVDPARFHFFDPDTGAVLGRATTAVGA